MKRFKNGVSIHEQHLRGYGGPETWRFRVVFENREMARDSATNEREAGRVEATLEARWSRVTVKELRSKAKRRPVAFSLCERCEKPIDDGGGASMGVTSKVAGARVRSGLPSNPSWCSACAESFSGVIEEWPLPADKSKGTKR